MHRGRWVEWPGAALLLLALAFGLRVYRLDGPSLWYDEAFSIALARSGIWQPLEAHPPLFYLILRLWMALAGSSEFSARFLSVGAGVLTVALFGAAAARLGRSRWAGLLGLALSATLPFWIWESREVRMYSALGMWTALALWMELRGRPGGTALAVLAGVYTHYAMLWMVPGWLLLGGRRRDRWPWALVIALGAAPGALHALWVGQTQGAFWPGRLDLIWALGTLGQAQALQARMAGLLPPPGSPWLPGLIAGAVALAVGLLLGIRSRAVRVRWVWLSLLPLAIGLGLLYRSPKFHPHYFIGVTVAFYLAVVLGWAGGVRRSRGVLWLGWLLAWGLFVGPALLWVLGHAEQTKDDWRGAVRTVEARRGPEEAVVLVSGFALPAYQVYARSTAPIPLPADPVADVRHVLDYERVAPVLNAVLSGTSGAWLVQWGDEINDPAQVVAAALDWVGDEVETWAFGGGIRVRRFRWGSFRRLPTEPEALFGHAGQPVGPNLRWLGYGLPGGELPIDRSLPVIAGWRTTGPLPSGLRASLRLEWEDGTVWGQWDGALGGETWDTARWPYPRIILARYEVTAQVGTPPGRYQPRLVVYRGGEVWLDARLNPVVRAAPSRPYEDSRWTGRPRAQWPGLTLAHVDLEGEPRACRELTVALWWRVEGSPPAARVRVRIGEAQGVWPWNPAQPEAIWGPGERWRVRYRVPVPCNPGHYPLEVAVGEESGQRVGMVEVVP